MYDVFAIFTVLQEFYIRNITLGTDLTSIIKFSLYCEINKYTFNSYILFETKDFLPM